MSDRHPTHYLSITGPARRAAVVDPEEEAETVGLLLKERNLSYGGWIRVTILVIDNEECIRFSFSRFLAAEGHQVTAVKSYREALAKLDEAEFELILADIFLDDGWGIDILSEVMKRKLKTRVIIMTASPSKETAQDSFRMHAVDYLVKPLDQGGLIHSVNKAMQ